MRYLQMTTMGSHKCPGDGSSIMNTDQYRANQIGLTTMVPLFSIEQLYTFSPQQLFFGSLHC